MEMEVNNYKKKKYIQFHALAKTLQFIAFDSKPKSSSRH